MSSHRTEMLGNVVDGVVSGAGKLVAPVAKVVGKGIGKVKSGITKSRSLIKNDFAMFPSPELPSPFNNHRFSSDIYWSSSDSYSRRYDNYSYCGNDYQNDDIDKENKKPSKPTIKKTKKKPKKIGKVKHKKSNSLKTIKETNENNNINRSNIKSNNDSNNDIFDLIFNDFVDSNNVVETKPTEPQKPNLTKLKQNKKPFGGQRTILAMIDPTKLKRGAKPANKTKKIVDDNNDDEFFGSNNNFKDSSPHNNVNNWVTFDKTDDIFECDPFNAMSSDPFINSNSVNTDRGSAKSVSRTQNSWVTF